MPWINTQPQVLLVALVGVLLVGGVFCPMGVDVADAAVMPFSESGDSLPSEPEATGSPFAFISSVFAHLSAPTMTPVVFPVALTPAMILWNRYAAPSEKVGPADPQKAPPGPHRALFLRTHAFLI